MLSHFLRLRKLYAWKNRIQFVPREIGSLTLLAELDLASNRLSDLPLSMEYLTNLRTLNLQDNQFTDYPRNLPANLVMPTFS